MPQPPSVVPGEPPERRHRRPGGPAERPPARHLRIALIGAVALALVLAAVIVGGLLRGGGKAYGAAGSGGTHASPTATTSRAPSPDRGGTRASAGQRQAERLAEASQLLARQSRAVLHRDRSSYLGTLDPATVSRGWRDLSGRTYDNLARMRPVAFAYDHLAEDQGALTPQRRAQLGGDAWVVSARMTFRLPGPDYRNVWTTDLRLVFVKRGDTLYLAGDREGLGTTGQLPLWLEDTVHVVRAHSGLVIGTGSHERLEAYASLVDRAVPRVSEVWGTDWSRYVVLVVPRTQAQMETVIGAAARSQGEVAAVATSVGRGNPESAAHIVINPATFGRLGPNGRLIVLTHESTHVATHATVSAMPMWLSEGFADYVGFRDSGLPTSVVARELFDRIHADGTPGGLPTGAEFDPRGKDLDQAYEAAWTACRYIAERWGEKVLVRFYAQMDQADGASAQDRVYRQVLGIDPEGFTAAWRDYLGDLARDS